MMFAAFCMLTGMEAKSIPQNDTRWQRIYSRQIEVQAVKAFRYLRSRNIEPILIKGWAAARNYPAETPRFYTDIDLAVSRDDFDSARALLASEEGSRLTVDLHREFKHLDSKLWEAVLADSQSVELDGYSIRIPSAEDHLRILAAHWLVDGGENKNRLWDIYHAVVNRPPGFDWEKCFSEGGERRRGWILATIGLTNRYLGLPLDNLPFAAEARDLPPWLIKTVEREWESGIRSVPLVVCVYDPAAFFQQLRKRLPPNPLQATIEMGGDIRNGRRFLYQIGSMRKRFLPSVTSIAEKITMRWK